MSSLDPKLSMSIELDGLSELIDNMAMLDRDLAGKALEDGVDAAAQTVRRGVIGKVRFRAPEKEESILAEVERAGTFDVRARVGVRGGKRSRGGKWHWRFHEWGTAKMKARPFMRPGMDASKEQAQRDARDAIWRRLLLGNRSRVRKSA